jgi:phosphatidylinositol dimannoside acyltransferase
VTSTPRPAPVTVDQDRRRVQAPTLTGRLRVALLRVFAGIAGLVPDRVLHPLAQRAGIALYLAQPRRRRLVRANLQRVCSYLADQGLANAATAAAARDPQALERLVRAAFGHYLRGYLEAVTLTRHTSPAALDRIAPDDQAVARAAFGPAEEGHPLILIGMHFGAIEIPALWSTHRLSLHVTAPMETVGDAAAQAHFTRTRRATGLNIIPLEGAAPVLRGELAAGHVVALVADRPLAGSGTTVELFGAPARLPLGPAVLALESGAPTWLVTVRRTEQHRYRGRLEQIEMPASGTRRERLAAFVTLEARAFERAVADAPEQWWTLFFPIWRGAEQSRG